MASGTEPGHRHSDLFGEAETHEPAWLNRLRADFRLTIVTLFGACAILVILPFAVYRYLAGDLLIAVVDLALVSIMGVLVLFAWLTGNSVLAGRLVALSMTAGFASAVTFLGISIMWAFPLVVANFLLADRLFAVATSIVVLLVVVLQPALFPELIELWSFLAAGVLASFFGWIFASRTEMQRRQLADLAAHDSLTGAGNRRALRKRLDEAFREFHDKGRAMALALLDLDHFKQVNDSYGHDEGDRVLVELVRICKRTVRQSDRIYRIGGEEFIVLFPDTRQAGLEIALEKLHAAVRSELNGPDEPVTVSIGAAVLEAGEDIRSWLGRADAALYRAKHRGRDRIELC